MKFLNYKRIGVDSDPRRMSKVELFFDAVVRGDMEFIEHYD